MHPIKFLEQAERVLNDAEASELDGEDREVARRSAAILCYYSVFHLGKFVACESGLEFQPNAESSHKQVWNWFESQSSLDLADDEEPTPEAARMADLASAIHRNGSRLLKVRKAANYMLDQKFRNDPYEFIQNSITVFENLVEYLKLRRPDLDEDNEQSDDENSSENNDVFPA